ncbi:MAG: hypothetical protein J7L23_04655 [Candidatus Diapherotrites archaeon]|nr:hypothetical protein [Candidatus Diapherotrites archaeon]
MNLRGAEKKLKKLYEVKDKLLIERKKVVMNCAQGIRAVHVGKYALARSKLKTAKTNMKELEALVRKNPGLSNLLNICYQEIVELESLLSVIETGKLPDVDVPPDAYLLGVLDALGELKRTAMGLLMKGKYDDALKLYETMEDIHYSIEGFAFPNSLVDGFKRKQDVMKHVLEKLYDTLVEAKMRGNGKSKN